MIREVDLFLFVSLEELKTPKSPFKINWPLESSCYTYWKPSFLRDVDQSLTAINERLEAP